MKRKLLSLAALLILATAGCNQSNNADQNPPNTNSVAQNAEQGASNAWQDTKNAATNAWGDMKSGATNAWNHTTNAINGSSTN